MAFPTIAAISATAMVAVLPSWACPHRPRGVGRFLTLPRLAGVRQQLFAAIRDLRLLDDLRRHEDKQLLFVVPFQGAPE